MKNKLSLLLSSVLLIVVSACTSAPTSKYIIGVSQCSDDAWRTKMNEEMNRELIFHSDMTLRIRQAQDNSELQCAQIDSFISEKVDLLIVSPNEAEEVKPAVSRAYDAGIPVIVADRQVTGEKYTAFIGGDNYAVGTLMAEYVCRQAEILHRTALRPLRVLEITGLPGSTPMRLRHEGLVDGIQNNSNIIVVGTGCGDWFQRNARLVVDSLLNCCPNIDVILAQNDQMAIGAYEACHKRLGDNRPLIMGVDGIVGHGGGVEALLNGVIDVTASYPSKGDLVIQTAAKILHGEAYPRDVVLQTILIDRTAAEPIQQIAEEIDHQVHLIDVLEQRLNQLWDMSRSQQVAIACLMAFLLVVVILGVVLYNLYLYRQRVRAERAEHAIVVARQKEQLESITAELERTKQTQSLDEQFIQRLQTEIEKHIADTDFSVEMLSDAMNMSRTQLFRRTKQLMGLSPVELIRHVRLRRGQQMLRNTDMTIQQIAYSVGFTSPSYFTKCYKELFGSVPADEQRSSTPDKQ